MSDSQIPEAPPSWSSGCSISQRFCCHEAQTQHELFSLSHQVNRYLMGADLEPGSVGAAEGTEQVSTEHLQMPPHCAWWEMRNLKPRDGKGCSAPTVSQRLGFKTRPGSKRPLPPLPALGSLNLLGGGRIYPLAWSPLVTQVGLRWP